MAIAKLGFAEIAEGGTYTPEAGADFLVFSGAGESSFSSRQIVGMTFGGVTCTQAVYASLNNSVKGGLWYIKAADIPAGTSTLVVDWDGQIHSPFIGGVYSLSGVDQTTPIADTDFGVDITNGVLDLSLVSTVGSAILAGGMSANDNWRFSEGSTNTASDSAFAVDADRINAVSHRSSQISSLSTQAAAETVGLRWFNVASTGAVNGYAVVIAATAAPVGPDYTQRKGSTFDAAHGLGTITTATLGGNAIQINTTGAGTVNLTDTSGITTSGEYPLVLGDGTGTETYTVQVNVVGLPSFNINKDGADQASLADVEFIALSGTAGSRAVADQVSGITTDVNGDTGPIEFTDLALSVGDTVFVVQYSPTVSGGHPGSATLEAI